MQIQKLKRKRCVGFIVFLQVFALLDATAEDAVMVLPTTMCRGYFFVPITLSPKEGYSEDRTLWFLHDTGASTSYVDPDSIERVANVRPASGTRVNMRDVSIGPLDYSRISAEASELDHLSVALGRRIDGILSFGAFKDFLLTLDYQKGQLRLERGELPKPDGVNVFSSKGKDSRPWTDVTFANRTRRMLIDSGAGTSSLVLRRLDKYETQSSPLAVGTTAGFRSDDVEIRSSARAAQPVLIGPHALHAVMLSSTKDTEIIGGDVMRHFEWTFDQANKRFRVTRKSPETQMVSSASTGFGLIYSPTAEGLLVQGILEGAPAHNADIIPGDLITRFNGDLMAERGCHKMVEGDVTVEVLRDGEFHDVTIEIYTLVP